MKIDIQLFSDEEIIISDNAVVAIFIDGKQFPAYSSIVKAGTFVTVILTNPMFDLELKKKRISRKDGK
jgi:hypothetical protein